MTLGVGMNLDLNLEEMATLLDAVAQGVKNIDLPSRLSYHKSRVASIKSWASHMDLFSSGSGVSSFGERLLRYDPAFQQPITRLILYYHLARNPKAEVFHYLVNYFLCDAALRNQTFDVVSLQEASNRVGLGAHSQALKQVNKELPLMFRTVRREQAFGGLGLLSSDTSKHFSVHPPILNPAFVAYAIYDEWSADIPYVSFEQLEQPGRLARVCLLSRSALVNVLRTAGRLGYIGVQEEAGFDRVSRVPEWNAERLLEVLYA